MSGDRDDVTRVQNLVDRRAIVSVEADQPMPSSYTVTITLTATSNDVDAGRSPNGDFVMNLKDVRTLVASGHIECPFCKCRAEKGAR